MAGQSSGAVIAITLVFTILALVAVVLRLWARHLTKQPIKTDDYLSVISLVTMIGLLTVPTLILCVDANFGNHEPRLPTGQVPPPPSHLYNVCEYVTEVCSYLPIAFAKASLLFFYRRIFRGQLFMAAVWTLLGITIVWCVAFMFGNVFECTPISKSLNEPMGSPGIHCIDVVELYYASASVDVVIDFAILLLPWPIILRLQMPTKQKFAVGIVFLLGALATAASIARLVVFIYAGRQLASGGTDITYFLAPPLYWTVIEAGLAIVAVCLPSLRPAFHQISFPSFLSALWQRLRRAPAPSPSNDAMQPQSNRISDTRFAHLQSPSKAVPQYPAAMLCRDKECKARPITYLAA